MHGVDVLRKNSDKNCKKAQEQYKKNYDNNVRSEQCFLAGDYLFVERSHPTASAADKMAHERYWKLLYRLTRSYQAISFGPENAKIDQDGIRNIVSISRLTRTVKEERIIIKKPGELKHRKWYKPKEGRVNQKIRKTSTLCRKSLDMKIEI